MIGVRLKKEENFFVLEIHEKELAEDLAESFAGYAQVYMNTGNWEEAEECLHITNLLNNRKEIWNGGSDDL